MSVDASWLLSVLVSYDTIRKLKTTSLKTILDINSEGGIVKNIASRRLLESTPMYIAQIKVSRLSKKIDNR